MKEHDMLKVLTADNITLTAQRDVLKEQNERLKHSNDLLRTQAYELVNQVNELKRKRDVLLEALTRIDTLDPEIHSNEGHNEWGEADCFGQAKNIARTALEDKP